MLLLGCSSPFKTPDGTILPANTVLFLLPLHQSSYCFFFPQTNPSQQLLRFFDLVWLFEHFNPPNYLRKHNLLVIGFVNFVREDLYIFSAVLIPSFLTMSFCNHCHPSDFSPLKLIRQLLPTDESEA